MKPNERTMTNARSPEATSQHEEPGGGIDSGAQALAVRQAALADAYPDEYVVLLVDRVIAHTQDKEEAYAQYDAAFEGDAEPIILPPGALRRIQPPVIRGRAFAPAHGRGPR